MRAGPGLTEYGTQGVTVQIEDLRSLPPGEPLACDLCIVGSGPAGSTLLSELAGSGLHVILLESGGLKRHERSDQLNEVESIGAARADGAPMRARVLGGTSDIWTGRCAPFDPIDYRQRPWVPHSGWPFGPEELRPHFGRALLHLGLGPDADYTGQGFWQVARRAPPQPQLADDSLAPFFWQYSRDARLRYDAMRFGPQLQSLRGGSTRVLTDATVLHVDTNWSASRVEGVEVADAGGGRRTVKAPRIVLCAGGIENARLLLASNRAAAAGLGNGHDLVGRFLMDHPRGSVASFRLQDYPRLRRHFAIHNVRTERGSHVFTQGVSLSPAAQEREELLNCAAWLTEIITPDDPWSALKRVFRARSLSRQDAAALAGNMGLLARGVHRHLLVGHGLPRKVLDLRLSCTVEQRPDPASRVTLADRVDRFGMPLSRIDWRIDGQEQRTVRRMAELVGAGLQRLRLHGLALDEWVRDGDGFPPSFRDAAHPTGATRMADDPRNGVVDRHGQVHGVDGLYVAGSSTFPTAGHANPTLMIVALAIRLADRLRQRERQAAPAVAAHH